MLNKHIPDAIFNIASLFSHDKATLDFIQWADSRGTKLPITSVHGSPSVLWHGGRNIENISDVSDTHIDEIFKAWEQAQIGVYLTFSNWHLTPEDLEDEKCNNILTKLSVMSGDNGVIVVSDILTKYIRDNYPTLKIKSSIDKITKESKVGNVNYYKKLLDIYDYVNIHTDDGHNNEVLNSLKNESPRLEIILNEPCVKKCPYRKKEHNMFSKSTHGIVEDVYSSIKCNTYKNIELDPIDPTQYSFFSRQRVESVYNMGYRLFKLQGRTDHWNIYSEMLKFYLVDELFDFYSRLNTIGSNLQNTGAHYAH
jgi:hypothetical protein